MIAYDCHRPARAIAAFSAKTGAPTLTGAHVEVIFGTQLQPRGCAEVRAAECLTKKFVKDLVMA